MNRIKGRIRREILTAVDFNPASLIELELNGIVTELLVTDNDLEDILCSAFNGIAYWCKDVYPKDGHWEGYFTEEHIVKGGTLILKDLDGKQYQLNKFKMLRGIAYLIESSNLDLSSYGFENKDAYYVNAENTLLMLKASHCLYTVDIDAYIADLIVQYGIFGKQVFA